MTQVNRDPFDLRRFLEAQDDSFALALEELQSGKKRSHWMWFIFPQMRGLGHSSTAQFYGISSLAEAKAYIEHPILGQRLIQCTEAIIRYSTEPLNQILGSPDDLKFCSSMTLFSSAASGKQNIYSQALDIFCKSKADKLTLSLLDKNTAQ